MVPMLILGAFLFLLSSSLAGREVFSPEDVLKLKGITEAKISSDGERIAYTVSVPRKAGEEPGSAYSELHLLSVKTGETRPFITGRVSVHSIQWSPDGSQIAFLTQRGEKPKTQVCVIPVDGGESVQFTHSKTDVSAFRWHPSGTQIAYVAATAATKREEELEKRGYGFVFFEEDLKHRNLYLIDVDQPGKEEEAVQLTEGITVWSFEFSPDGETIAAALSEKNLVDHEYMFQRIHLLDVESKRLRPLTKNEGKLGNFSFSPDGSRLAYGAAREERDHAVSQVYSISTNGGEAENLTPVNFPGHVNWVGWKDKETVLYHAGEGVWPTLSTVPAKGGERKVILHGQETGMVFNPPSFTGDCKHFVLVGNSPDSPGDVYYWDGTGKVKRRTTVNPWIPERTLGRQEVILYPARDGLRIEGILIYPVEYQSGKEYPLVVFVHGGPESHVSNGWLTNYFRLGQVLAGRGYAVFYPNYRASTGYGVDFALEGYEDPAGKEFDDVADGIEYLIAQGIADPERVGLGGASYGGYAAAWFSSYYTKYVRAVCMFVGISDLISKRGTTDIPYEELCVHSGKKLEDMWELSLRRSPVYWAHQSRTAVLILGGTADTRVHPSQSLEYYRRLKMNGHPAVRLVQYPGEGHGNRKQPGRTDVLYRQLQWYDWYVKDKKPLEGPMPPLDISEKYGLDLE